MRSFRLVSLLALAAASALFANPCVTGTLTSYISLGVTGCTIGPFTVKDFTFSVISSTQPVTSSDVTLSPSIVGIMQNLGIGPTNPLSPIGFVAGPADSIKFQIAYFWDPGSLGSYDDAMYDPVTPPGFSRLTIDGCENANFVGLVCPTTAFTLTLAATTASQTHVTASRNFATPVTTLGIRDTIDIEGMNCAEVKCADITGITDTSTLPEPSSLTLGLLPAAGGLLCAWFRRRSLHPR